MKQILTFIGIFFFFTIKAQFYNTGSHSTSTRWKQIETNKFQIIYPLQNENSAQHLANTLSQTTEFTAKGLNSNVKRPIKIVMHDKNVLSNGYVVWAPRRMEIVSTPPQNTYSQNWMEQLALHEYRHVTQMEKLNQGFTKGLSLLTGEIAIGATSAFLPLWFLEGDAVFNETSLSNTGRGREPEFIQDLKAIELQEKKRLTYDQIYLGTYRTKAPNHYKFGYQMSAWAETNYPGIWSKTLDNVAKHPFTLAPFYRGLKKNGNLTKTTLYENTFEDLKIKWKKEESISNQQDIEEIPVSYKSNFVSYKNIHVRMDGSIIAMRTTIDDVTKLVCLKNGKEEIMKTIGAFYGSQISVTEKYVAWEELRYDLRWKQQTYSVIKIFDIEKGTTKILKRAERHFSPSINPSETEILTQKITDSNNSLIDIYNIKTKQLVKVIKHPDNYQMTFNNWVNDSTLAVVVSGEKGKSIYTINIKTDKWEKVFGWTFQNISNLRASKNNIYFTYTLDGSQNIYRLDLLNKNVSRVSNSVFGANYASISNDGNSMYFSEYSSKGYKPKKVNLNQIQKVDIHKITPYRYAFIEEASKKTPINIQDSVYNPIQFESKKYNKLLNTVNIHSWLIPFYANMDEISSDISTIQENLNLGLTLFSQNVLSTVTSTLGYYRKNGINYFHPSITISSFYPIVVFDMFYGGSSRLYGSNVKLTSVPKELKAYSKIRSTVYIPFNLTTNSYSSYLVPKLIMSYENIYYVDSNNYEQMNYDIFDNQLYYYKGYLTSELIVSYYITSKLSQNDINPRWGVSLYLNHLAPQLNKVYSDKNTVLLATAYLPGIFRHQSIKINAGIETGRGMRMQLPRGYNKTEVLSLKKSNKISISYTLPLLYPDLSIGPLAYIKRVHTELFYDRTNYTQFIYKGYLFNNEGNYTSYGVDLGFEMNFLRFYFPFTPTIRYNYLDTIKDSRVSFYITTSFSF